MKLGLLHLMLLAELLVRSTSRPTHSPLYGMLRSMVVEVEQLIKFCKTLHDLSEDQVHEFAVMEYKLKGLPHLHHTPAHISSMKPNESLSKLYVYTQSFKQHMDWLKTTKDSVRLSSQSVEGASTHLLVLSNLLNASLHQISEEVPQPPSTPPSFPPVSSAFDALTFSIEVAERLRMFCNWSKRVLRCLQTHFPRH